MTTLRRTCVAPALTALVAQIGPERVSAHPFQGGNHGAHAQAALPGGTLYETNLGLRGRPNIENITGAFVAPGIVAPNVRPMQIVAKNWYGPSGQHAAVGYYEGCLAGEARCSGTFYNNGNDYTPNRRMYTDGKRCTPPNYSVCEYFSYQNDSLALGSDPLFEVHRYVGPGCGNGSTAICWATLINGSFRRRWDSGMIRGYAIAGAETERPVQDFPALS